MRPWMPDRRASGGATSRQPRSHGLRLAVGVALVAAHGVAHGLACLMTCDDANVCNGIETCDVDTGECRAGVPLSCDDHDACTVDSCDPVVGCVYDAAPGILCVGSALSHALDVVRSAPPADVGGVATKRRLVGDLLAIQSAIDALSRTMLLGIAERPCPRCERRIRRLQRRLCRTADDVEHIVDAGRVTGDVADALRAVATPLASACHPVLPAATVTSPPSGR